MKFFLLVVHLNLYFLANFFRFNLCAGIPLSSSLLLSPPISFSLSLVSVVRDQCDVMFNLWLDNTAAGAQLHTYIASHNN